MNTIKQPSHYNTYQTKTVMTYIYKYIIAFAVIALMSGCKNEIPETSSDTIEAEPYSISIDQKQFTSSKFELGKIEQQLFSKVLNATGSIHIPEKSKAAVSTLMSGTVGAINLIEGQWVSKGQKMFAVTNPELINLQEEYLVATGRLEYLREEYNRQLELSKENLSTKKDLLKAKSELTTTQARHGSLSQKLSLYGINADNLSASKLVSSLIVIAPISGYVSQIDVIQGMYIEPNQSALTLVNTSQVFLELSVLEKDAVHLKKGLSLSFTLQGSSTKIFNATIYLINKSINSKNMIIVNCTIDEDLKQFIPGMYANAEILLEDDTVNALPESAVVKIGEVSFVLSLKNKDNAILNFDKVAVQTGAIQNGHIELINLGETANQYLTKGAYFLIQ